MPARILRMLLLALALHHFHRCKGFVNRAALETMAPPPTSAVLPFFKLPFKQRLDPKCLILAEILCRAEE